MEGRQQDAAGPAAAPPPDLRLPRDCRLSPRGYRATFDGGRALAGKLLVLWVRNPGGGAGGVGTVASKRTLPLAVARNRARRLMRESYRLNRHNLKSGVEMVLVARARIRDADRGAVAEDFRRLCRQAGVWRDAP
jgi:ribonuclease P protein component